MKNYWSQFTQKSWALVVLLALAAVIHVGTTISGGLYADDYIHAAMFTGSDVLAEKQLLDGIDVGELESVMANQFNFFNPEVPNYQAMQAYGIIPWWATEGAKLHFFRPISVITHYIDYQLWPDNSHMMHFISLAWYVLSLYLIYRVYQVVGMSPAAGLFAVLLLILDQSVFQVVSWIASRSMLIVMVFGFASIYAYHRGVSEQRWYMLAMLLFMLALFSAEGAIGICAYIGAYTIAYDNRRWSQRVVYILPFIVMAVLWRVYYQAQGYGTFGVDFYLDPGQQPGKFIETALLRLPGNLFELVAGVDFISGQVRPDLKVYFSLAGALLVPAILWLVWPVLKAERTARFFLLGSFFAMVPGLAIALAPRTMLLPFVGLAAFLAILFEKRALLVSFWQSKMVSALKAYTVFFHIGISALLAGNMLFTTVTDSFSDKGGARGKIGFSGEEVAGKHVVIVNAQKPFWLAFTAHRFAYEGQEIPESIRLLGSAFYQLALTRLEESRYELIADPAIQLDREPLVDLTGRIPGHYLYLTQELLGLIRSQESPWQEGQRFAFDDIVITVRKLYQGKPAKLEIELLKPEDSYQWYYWSFEEKALLPMGALEIGQRRDFDGAFQK